MRPTSRGILNENPPLSDHEEALFSLYGNRRTDEVTSELNDHDLETKDCKSGISRCPKQAHVEVERQTILKPQ